MRGSQRSWRQSGPDLQRLVAETLAEAWDRPSPHPGWSCRQLLAHIASGDWLNQRVVHAALAGRDIVADRRGQDVDEENATWLQVLAPYSPQQLFTLACEHRQETLALWEELTEEHLALPIAGWRPGLYYLRDYLHRFPDHERQHLEQLRQGLAGTINDR